MWGASGLLRGERQNAQALLTTPPGSARPTVATRRASNPAMVASGAETRNTARRVLCVHGGRPHPCKAGAPVGPPSPCAQRPKDRLSSGLELDRANAPRVDTERMGPKSGERVAQTSAGAGLEKFGCGRTVDFSQLTWLRVSGGRAHASEHPAVTIADSLSPIPLPMTRCWRRPLPIHRPKHRSAPPNWDPRGRWTPPRREGCGMTPTTPTTCRAPRGARGRADGTSTAADPPLTRS